MYDLVIVNGTLVDGTGAPPVPADVAVQGDRVVAVGTDLGPARRTLDASGRLVLPGFVDPHTHLDAQVLWDDLVEPSSGHGVTTAVFGNCGVGFAPAGPEHHDRLVSVMAGVEDLPVEVMHAGIGWAWGSFGQYLDAVDAVPHAIDTGGFVTHTAVRFAALGDRAAQAGPLGPDDIAAVAAVVRRALAEGALGFSTSRTSLHVDLDGSAVPGTSASWAELDAVASELAAAGGRPLELALPSSYEDPAVIEATVGHLCELSARHGVPVMFNSALNHTDPHRWEVLYAAALEARQRGARLHPQVLGRAQTVVIGLQGVHPFARCPGHLEVAHLPLDERVARLAEPERRARILAEEQLPPEPGDPFGATFDFRFDQLYPLEDPPRYAPPRSASVAAVAERTGRPPREVVYDLLLADGGRSFLLYVVMNHPNHDPGPLREMMLHPCSVFGLSDAGAHNGMVCDAGVATSLLTQWCRDADDELVLPLQWLVHGLSAEPAAMLGLTDRGVVTPGKRADLNVVDLDALACRAPRMVTDLPTGARRLVQDADGIDATVVGGRVTRLDGADTGERPGKALRAGVQPPTS